MGTKVFSEMYVYARMYMCMVHACMYIRMYVHVHSYSCISYTYIHVCIYSQIYAYIHIYISILLFLALPTPPSILLKISRLKSEIQEEGTSTPTKGELSNTYVKGSEAAPGRYDTIHVATVAVNSKKQLPSNDTPKL